MNMEIIEKNKENQQAGFLKLIIFIIVAIFLLKYFNLTFADVLNWIKNLFSSIS